MPVTRPYDIQFTPASLFHFVVIFFDCVQNSMDPRPVMSPTPNRDSFQPPNENGSRGTGTPTFTPTIPPNHSRRSLLHDVTGDGARFGIDRSGIPVRRRILDLHGRIQVGGAHD